MTRKKGNLDEPATKGFVMEAVDAVLEGVERLLDIKLKEQDERINKRFDKQDQEMKWMRQDINDLKADTVPRSEFNELKKVVYKHHPLN